jgi:L-ascorbate metabolism protein UlaG (beta-lactamase superfamily)
MSSISKAILATTASIGIIYLVAFCCNKRPRPPFSYRKRKPNRKYNTPDGWEGTPIDGKDRFLNHQYPFYQNYVDILNWLPSHAANLVRNRNKEYKVLKREMKELMEQDNILVWLGHASFFLKVSGKTILIDPHFRSFFPYKRHTENPITPESFTGIDYILISHDHADHLSKKSIAQLVAQNPSVQVLSGLRMNKIIHAYTGIPKGQIICADWFEQYALSDGNVSIHFVPTRHYCKRIDTSFNRALWGGFIIEWRLTDTNKLVIFFGGDSGYGNHYKMIKEIYKPDIAILGIGAYAPRWFMEPNHMNASDVMTAFNDVGAKKLIPMHYLTFNLSCESMDEPLTKIQALAGKSVEVLEIGEVYRLAKPGFEAK